MGEDHRDPRHEDNDAHDAEAADPCQAWCSRFVADSHCPYDTARLPSGVLRWPV